MKRHPLLVLLLLAHPLHADEIQPFEAIYEITRGGKVTGKQTTQLEKVSDTQWIIKDIIIGTKGMASFIGFKRTETTAFNYLDGNLFATHHEMKQKAAFSNKKYTFDWQTKSSKFAVTYKDQTNLFDPKGQPIISAQLMPIELALAACKQQNNIRLLVLKNKTAKPYQFKISNNKNLMAERIYQGQVKKMSKTWLDPQRQCLPIKQSHQEGGDPKITTTLKSFKWL